MPAATKAKTVKGGAQVEEVEKEVKNAPEVDELATTYAALILADEGLAIDEAKLRLILAAAHVKVQPFYPSIFAGALGKHNVQDLILKGGSGSGGAAPAAAAAAPAAAAGGAAKPEEKKKEEKKPEPEEEGDDDMGLSLFD